MLAAAALLTLAVERGRRSSLQPEPHRQRRMVTDWTQKPHIVLWLVDDQGWANAGWNNQHVYTPRMDTMAVFRADRVMHEVRPCPSRHRYAASVWVTCGSRESHSE